MVGEEGTTKCQNHKLKKVFEEMNQNTVFFKRDFDAITEVATFVSTNGNIRRELSANQRINELSELSLFLFNETRWEGRPKVLKRFIDLKESLVEIFKRHSRT